MDTIKIYSPIGLEYGNFPITDQCERSAKIMGEDYVRLRFHSVERVVFDAFSYLEYENQTFFLPEQYVPSAAGAQYAEGGVEVAYYTYDVKFVSVGNMLSKHICYRHVVVGEQTWDEPEININGNLETLYTIIVGSITRASERMGTCHYKDLLRTIESTKDDAILTQGTKLLAFNFSGENIADVCTKVANAFTNDDKKETEWYITEAVVSGERRLTLHFSKCINDVTHIYSDYATGALKKIEYAQAWSGIPQVIVPYGSDRNMSQQATKGIDEITNMQATFGKRLRLTPNTNYNIKDNIWIGTDENGALHNDFVNTGIEVVKFYDEIYPQCHFKVDSVTVKNKRQDGESIPEYTIVATAIDNNGNAYDPNVSGFFPIVIEEGTTLSVRFESGLLNGREFEISNKTTKGENESKYSLKFTIVADGSLEDGTLIPSGNFVPRTGDKFALFNMKMPDVYIQAAKIDLARRAYEELVELQEKRPEVKCTTNPVIFVDTLCLGDRTVVSSELFNSDRQFDSRVVAYSYFLTKPREMQFTLASAIMQGTLSTMKEAIDSVTNTTSGIEQRTINLSRRGWRDASEMAEMIDSLASEMMLVGVAKYQFAFSSSIVWDSTNKQLVVSAGTLAHTQSPYTEWGDNGQWVISNTALSADENNLALDANTPYYLYAIVDNTTDPTARIVLSTIQRSSTINNNIEDKYLLMGILSSEYENGRVFNRTNGYTALAGGTITTEQIQDANRRLIIDFQNGEIIAREGGKIKGNIEFSLSDTQIEEILGNLDTESIFGAIDGASQAAKDAQEDADDAVAAAGAAQKTADEAVATAGAAVSAAQVAEGKASALEYLSTALGNYTAIAGGLIVTSQMHLGDKTGKYIDKDGKEYDESGDGRTEQYRVNAGISGMNADNILLWGGGTYTEAVIAEQNNYVKDTDGNCITSLLKRDGTGKIGICRITDSELTVNIKDKGSVIIDASEDNGGIRFFNSNGMLVSGIILGSIDGYSNAPLDDTTTTGEDTIDYNKISEQYIGVGENTYTLKPQSDDVPQEGVVEVHENNYIKTTTTSITKKSITVAPILIDGSIEVQVEYGSNTPTGEFTIDLYNDNGKLLKHDVSSFDFVNQGGSNYIYKADFEEHTLFENKVIDDYDGNVNVIVTLNLQGNIINITSCDLSLSQGEDNYCKYKITTTTSYRYHSYTLVGEDGFVSVKDNKRYFVIDNSEIEQKILTSGLPVLSTQDDPKNYGVTKGQLYVVNGTLKVYQGL